MEKISLNEAVQMIIDKKGSLDLSNQAAVGMEIGLRKSLEYLAKAGIVKFHECEYSTIEGNEIVNNVEDESKSETINTKTEDSILTKSESLNVIKWCKKNDFTPKACEKLLTDGFMGDYITIDSYNICDILYHGNEYIDSHERKYLLSNFGIYKVLAYADGENNTLTLLSEEGDIDILKENARDKLNLFRYDRSVEKKANDELLWSKLINSYTNK